MSYTKIDVTKPTDVNAGSGGKKKNIVHIFDWDDVSTYTRDGNVSSQIVMKNGCYMLKIYFDHKSIKGICKSSGDMDVSAIEQTVQGNHPGNKQEIVDFRSNWMNRNCGVIIEKGDGTKKIFGDPTAPLKLDFDHNDDEKQNSTAFTFKTVVVGPDCADYTSTYTETSPMATVAANATTIDVTNGSGNYQLTTGTASAAAITTVSNATHGGIYTLLGSGGTYPSTLATSATILLKDGTSWTANANSQLTLKCIKDGSSSYKFYEIGRV